MRTGRDWVVCVGKEVAKLVTPPMTVPARAEIVGISAGSSTGGLSGHRFGRTCLAARLTARERQVAVLVVRGLLNKQIAFELGISEITVKLHRGNVMGKMEARSVAELVCKTGLAGL